MASAAMASLYCGAESVWARLNLGQVKFSSELLQIILSAAARDKQISEKKLTVGSAEPRANGQGKEDNWLEPMIPSEQRVIVALGM
mgnify:CR=1 FL=1